jgi:hypothetical protein
MTSLNSTQTTMRSGSSLMPGGSTRTSIVEVELQKSVSAEVAAARTRDGDQPRKNDANTAALPPRPQFSSSGPDGGGPRENMPARHHDFEATYTSR